MSFERDRVDGLQSLPSLRRDSVSVEADEATLTLPVAANHDIELYFPAPDGIVEARWLELATDLMIHLKEIDNEVQQISAEQWKQWRGKPCPSSYFEGKLAYVTLISADEAVLRYWVIGCNSEWDERYVRAPHGWVRRAEDA